MSAPRAEHSGDDAGLDAGLDEELDPESVAILAPAKLTLSLQVVGVRSDGYHLLDAEMVSIDLADTLLVRPGDRLTVRDDFRDEFRAGFRDGTQERSYEREPSGGPERGSVPVGPDNLVSRALRALGRRADVDLLKRVPPGAGLGGGSADAAAVLRWADCDDPQVALGLGADVPFCVAGGRAMVRGVGEEIEALPFVERTFTLLLVPFGMDTGAVYRAWDEMATGRRGATDGGNDLEAAACVVDARLTGWKRVFADASGRVPRLAGSGSTWFVEGTLSELGLAGPYLTAGDERARLVEVTTVPAYG